MYFFDKSKKIFKSSEEIISMFLGLAIVVVIVGLVFSFFQKKKGDITPPGVSNNNNSQLELKGNNQNGNGSANSSGEYTVVSGDSLWKIAQAKYNNGDMWTKIAQANNLKNPRVIKAGQKLTIPQLDNTQIASKSTKNSESPTSITGATNNNGNEYVVTKNDSLWKIAVKTYGDGYKWVQIWDANKGSLKNPGLIYSGNKLILPNLKG